MESAIKNTEMMVWCEEGQKYLYQSKRVLVLLTFVLRKPPPPHLVYVAITVFFIYFKTHNLCSVWYI